MQSKYFMIFKRWFHYNVIKTKLFFDEKTGFSWGTPLRATFVIIIIMSVEILDIYKCPTKDLENFRATFWKLPYWYGKAVSLNFTGSHYKDFLVLGRLASSKIVISSQFIKIIC